MLLVLLSALQVLLKPFESSLHNVLRVGIASLNIGRRLQEKRVPRHLGMCIVQALSRLVMQLISGAMEVIPFAGLRLIILVDL